MKKFFSSKKLLAAALTLAFAAGIMSSAATAASLSRKPQDNLIIGSAIEPTGLDPAYVSDLDSATLTYNIYESLLRNKPDSYEIEPCLAESWTISDDGKTYTFKLRQGVKFHDGTPFNAEAVKFNIDRQLPPKQTPQMAYAQLTLTDIESVKVIDEYTVEIKLKQSSTPFLSNMSISFGAAMISPTALKKYNNNVSNNPVGTGPYKFVSWDKGQNLVLTTNEDYWGPKPAVQNVIFRIIKDTSARVVALNNGEVDVINGVNSTLYDQIKSGGSKIYENESNNTDYMVFNCREGYVTADPEVRKAISQAINVPELVETLHRGFSTPAHSYFPSILAGYSKDVRTPAYDPEAAARVLAAKGVKELKLMAYSGARAANPAGGQVLAEAIQAYLKKAGVKVNIEVYDWANYRARMLTDKWDLCFIGWMGDHGDPDNFIQPLSSADPATNPGLWQNAEFIEKTNKARHMPEGAERVALYARANQIVTEDSGILPLYHVKNVAAYRPNISGQIIHPIGVLFFNQMSKK